MATRDLDSNNSLDIFDIVNQQGWEACQLTRQDVCLKVFAAGGAYVLAEHHIVQFNNLVDEQLGASEA